MAPLKIVLVISFLFLASCKKTNDENAPSSQVVSPKECGVASQSISQYSPGLLKSHTNRWLILFKEKENSKTIADFLERFHLQENTWVDEKTVSVTMDASTNQQELIELLLSDGRVRYVEPDYPINGPDDSVGEIELEKSLGSMSLLDEEWTHRKIHTFEAWSYSQGVSDVVVAVVDSGVDFNHSDLSSRQWINPDEVLNGIDDDGNGLVDDLYGWDYVQNDRFPYPSEATRGAYHGTHVAGIIAGVENQSVGFTGVAPRVKIMSLRFLNADKAGYTSDAVKAIRYAVNKGAKIINLSWGSYNQNSALMSALNDAKNKGVLIVASSGNNGDNNDLHPFYPASYSYSNIISVTSTSSYDNWVSGINYGVTSVDIGAPGLAILSTDRDNGYERRTGSSMSAPFVSGAAALLLSYQLDLDASAMKSFLLNGADKISKLTSRMAGGRRLNIENSLRQLNEQGATSVPPEPSVPPVPSEEPQPCSI